MPKLKILLLTIVSLFGSLVFAQTVRTSVDFGADFDREKGTYVFHIANNTDRTCGVEIYFGDGKSKEISISGKSVEKISYRYENRGIFSAYLISKEMRGWLSSAEPCTFSKEVDDKRYRGGVYRTTASHSDVIWITTSEGEGFSELDLLFYANPNFFGRNLDGSLSFSGRRQTDKFCGNLSLISPNFSFRPDRYAVKDVPIFRLWDLYKKLGVDLVHEAALTALQKSIRGTPPSQLRCEVESDRDRSFLEWPVVAIPRGFVSAAQSGPYAGLKDWSLISEVPYSELKAESKKIEAAKKQYQDFLQANVDQYLESAKSSPRLFIGTLLIGWNNKPVYPLDERSIPVCAIRQQSDLAGSAMFGHRALGYQMLLPHLRAHVRQPESTLPADNANGARFNLEFSSLNDAFLGLKSDPSRCRILVGFAEDLVQLETAFKRDSAKFDTQFGLVSKFSDSLERAARILGFDSHADRQYAKALGINREQLNLLKQFRINTLADYEEVVREKERIGHSSETAFSSVLQFLRDRQEANSKGITVTEEKSLRLARAAAEVAKAEEDRRKARLDYLREYPFEAVFSCALGNTRLVLHACFISSRGSLQTDLELRNGDQYGRYRIHHLERLGREERGVGFVIPLRSKFDLKVQNASDEFFLNLKIRETASGKVLYERSAGKFGVIRVAE